MNYWLKASLCVGLSFIAYPAYGQITPDGSLPTQVERQGNVTKITGGQQAGSNLFHSFENFSVGTGSEAWFNNTVEIDNVLSRVTGGNISSIDGLIRANGTANLFLINPAGIMFGDNAQLSIGGSFFGSTATGITFEDGTKFDSNDTGIPSLTISAPIGLDLRNATGNISSTASLKSDRSLTLSGNNLELQGQVEAGRDLILSANNNLIVKDTVDALFQAKAGNLTLQGGAIDIFALNNSASGLFSDGNLTLSSDNPINGDAHYVSGGSFRVEKLDGTLGDLISLNDPIIFSQGDVSLASYEGASLHVQSGGDVTIDGDVIITGVDTTENSLQETVTLTNGSQIEIDGNVEPTLDIRAGVDRVDSATESATASGSNITISGTVNNPGGKVFLTNRDRSNFNLVAGDITVAEIDTSNSAGNGGDVIINSRNDIDVANGIDTSSVTNAELTTQANLQTFSQVDISSGDGGAIALIAQNDINIGAINSFSQVNLDLNTEVNTINEANNIFAIPQARVSANTGGEINLQAGSDTNLGNIDSSSSIAIAAESTAVDNFSIITALLELDTADGGNISLIAGDSITTENISSHVAVGDRLLSSAETTPEITLSVSQIGLTIERAEIGSGGDIFLQAGSQIDTGSLDSSVSVTNVADNQGFIVANDAQTATAERPARVNSQLDLTYENTSIGRGGEININSDRANVDNLNSSIGITSESTVFAEANGSNDAAANAVAISDNSLSITGDRPGNIFFEVSQGFSFDTLNAAAINNSGINNLDSIAFTDSENAIATANADGTNIVNFITQSDTASIEFNLDVPDVDLAIDAAKSLTFDFVSSVTLNSCPVKSEKQIQGIETVLGKIYPATDAIISDGQIRLVARPNNRNSRDIISIPDCN